MDVGELSDIEIPASFKEAWLGLSLLNSECVLNAEKRIENARCPMSEKLYLIGEYAVCTSGSNTLNVLPLPTSLT